jgi:phosphopantothenoylcysteine decarboxylase/phosphopantothenate--cysteine ligase
MCIRDRVGNAGSQKMKKGAVGMPVLEFVENPDILATLSKMATGRPKLVVGFAAETERVVEFATAKRLRKGCDWIVANDVSVEGGAMGGSENRVTVITEAGAESWALMSKDMVARKLAARIAEALSDPG